MRVEVIKPHYRRKDVTISISICFSQALNKLIKHFLKPIMNNIPYNNKSIYHWDMKLCENYNVFLCGKYYLSSGGKSYRKVLVSNRWSSRSVSAISQLSDFNWITLSKYWFLHLKMEITAPALYIVKIKDVYCYLLRIKQCS